ncbi:energy transducer TonB [Thermodesulfobacteriota bacterium]
MKRILFSFILALGIHGLLLGMDFRWFKKKTITKPISRVISMTLVNMPLKRLDPKPIIKKPALPEKKVVTKIQKPPPKVKSRKKQDIPPKKIFKPIVPPKKKEPPKEVVKNPAPVSPEPSSPMEHPKTIETPLAPVPQIQEEVIKKPVTSAVEKDAAVTPPPVIQEARPLYQQNPKPKYPRIATKRGYQGTVLLNVLVNRNGSVDDLRVSTSSGYAILDKAAMKSVKDWLFVPGKRGNETADMWVVIPVRFQLE